MELDSTELADCKCCKTLAAEGPRLVLGNALAAERIGRAETFVLTTNKEKGLTPAGKVTN